MAEPSLREEAARRGIEHGYFDGAGDWCEADDATLRALLEALGPEVAAEAERVEPGSIDIPGQCHLPAVLADGGKAWGLSIQLYGLRSRHNWGIGDFGDLAILAERAARAGAAALQLNPLHALFTARPARCSPYSPSSRRMLNPLYIDISAVPELALSATAQRYLGHARFGARLAALRAAPGVDYAGVAALKLPLLRLLFGEFMDRHAAANSPRFREFVAFREQGGQALEDFALFEALDARLARSHPGGWPEWPAALRDRDHAACREFAERYPLEVLYPVYLQWLARCQLQQAQERARAAGMAIGLMADLAVGVDRIGADAWCDQEVLALDAEIGAPPDAFAAEGQAWGLPPWRPQVLDARNFAPWRDLLSANMMGLGGLRIDHIIGCERQFWVPRGCSGREGAYVRYSRDALLDVLADCSWQHRCLVIGEDLGTVPEGFSERLAGLSILSTRVVRFERYPDGLFRRPQTYPSLASACAGTHDLPPLAAWLEPQMPSSSDSEEIQLLEAALADAGLAPDSDAVEDRIAAVHGFLAATPCCLVLVQLEDVLAVREPANQPGTGPEQPNWQRKYPVDLACLNEQPAWLATATLLGRAGRAVSRG